MKTQISLVLAIAMAAAGCAPKAQPVSPGHFPQSWHQLPEAGAIPDEYDNDIELAESTAGPALDRILESTGNVLDRSSLESTELGRLNFSGDKPKDYVPWRAEYFLTDLSVSISGLIGLLTAKGSPSVALHWRRQGTVKSPDPVPVPTESPRPSPNADLVISDDTSPKDIEAQLDPVIRATIASGKVKDERGFRANALEAAMDFRSLVTGLADNPGAGYWPSRFRLDLTVDASSGKLVPIVTLGADLRLRFEWHRGQQQPKKPVPLAFTQRQSERARQLREFVSAMSYDIAAVGDEFENLDGFKAYGFRVGVGVTLKGEFGIVKGAAGAAGHVYFSRDVKKPEVRPAPLLASELDGTFPLIETGTTESSTLRYAAAHGISFLKSKDEIVYRVDRKKYRKGLKRAAKMASFFTRRAAKSSKRHWRIYELRAGFELSVSGDLAVVGVTGQAMTEIAFYNQGF